jgi:thiamine transport system substrate-binding protein
MKKAHDPSRLARHAAAAALLAAAALFTAGGCKSEKEERLVIYAYDSFVSEWGTGPKVIPKFEEQSGIEVTVESVGDAGQVLNRAILEKDEPRADILVGIDNNMLARAVGSGVLHPYLSPKLSRVPPELRFDPTHHVTPFDHGYFAIVYDSVELTEPPQRLADLAEERYRQKIIVEDPRTSSPGLGFLLWTIAVFGEDYISYWERLEPNLLTITEGWDTAYGMFTSGEAPMVLSYTTSPAYHAEYEDSRRFRALIFEEGNYLQIEGMGIVKGCPHPKWAKRFIDFVLTEDFQAEIPLTNWMYPVIPRTPLPDSFAYAPRPEQSLSLDYQSVEANQERWLREWAEAVTR